MREARGARREARTHPITTHLTHHLSPQYNPKCDEPMCFLQGSDGVERPQSLAELQDYITSENHRLEKDPVRCFDSREINIRMEYKYCPNLILIDTPGLIAAPRTPKVSRCIPPPPHTQQVHTRDTAHSECSATSEGRFYSAAMTYKYGVRRTIMRLAAQRVWRRPALCVNPSTIKGNPLFTPVYKFWAIGVCHRYVFGPCSHMCISGRE